MVFVIEGGGITCMIIAYFTVLIANASFISISIIPMHKEAGGFTWPLLLYLISYEIIIFMIFWSHLKAMLSDPGYVPSGYSVYKKNKLPKKA